MNRDTPLERITSGFRGRTWKTAKLASKVGWKAMKKNMGLGKSKADRSQPDGGDDQSPAPDTANIQALVDELDDMKGLMLKLGQMASYLEGSMPPAAQKVLARLQSSSRAMAWSSVTAVLEEAFQAPVNEVFENIEETPFAAASIGQVHRATTLDGQRVAVKVQYPGIAGAITSDLKTLGPLARLSTTLMPTSGSDLVAELRERLVDECDYRKEAANQTMFAGLLAGLDGARVPTVVAELSTERVLTTELVDALRFEEFQQQATQAAKNRAAETIFRGCFDSVFRRCVFNADPHPGNYLFSVDGEVTFLDFGCVRHFDVAFIDAWKKLALTVLDNRREEFPAAFVATGLATKTKGFDWDAQWDAVLYLYRPFLATEPFRYTADYVRESYDVLLWDNPNKYRTKLPPEWLFLNRLQWGLNSVMSALDASAPWGEIWKDAVRSPSVATPVAAG